MSLHAKTTIEKVTSTRKRDLNKPSNIDILISVILTLGLKIKHHKWLNKTQEEQS